MTKNNEPNEPLPLRSVMPFRLTKVTSNWPLFDGRPPLDSRKPSRFDGGDRAPDEPRPRRMLSLEQVLEIVPVSRATLFRMEKKGTFPKGTYISPNRRIWYEDEVVSWQNSVDEYNANRGRGKGRRRREGTA
jgi:prophage regulatory protein